MYLNTKTFYLRCLFLLNTETFIYFIGRESVSADRLLSFYFYSKYSVWLVLYNNVCVCVYITALKGEHLLKLKCQSIDVLKHILPTWGSKSMSFLHDPPLYSMSSLSSTEVTCKRLTRYGEQSSSFITLPVWQWNIYKYSIFTFNFQFSNTQDIHLIGQEKATGNDTGIHQFENLVVMFLEICNFLFSIKYWLVISYLQIELHIML